MQPRHRFRFFGPGIPSFHPARIHGAGVEVNGKQGHPGRGIHHCRAIHQRQGFISFPGQGHLVSPRPQFYRQRQPDLQRPVFFEEPITHRATIQSANHHHRINFLTPTARRTAPPLRHGRIRRRRAGWNDPG